MLARYLKIGNTFVFIHLIHFYLQCLLVSSYVWPCKTSRFFYPTIELDFKYFEHKKISRWIFSHIICTSNQIYYDLNREFLSFDISMQSRHVHLAPYCQFRIACANYRRKYCIELCNLVCNCYPTDYRKRLSTPTFRFSYQRIVVKDTVLNIPTAQWRNNARFIDFRNNKTSRPNFTKKEKINELKI